jgi:hypothetical protein
MKRGEIMFIKTNVLTVQSDGKIERRQGEVPAIVGCPALKVSTPADADGPDVVRMLRRLADEIEAQP